MKTELKPCPFCGGRAEARKIKNFDIEMYFIECECCSATSEKFTLKRFAIEAWNRRADDENSR